MLGLADKSALRALLATMLDGKPKELLKAIDDQYALGVEPLALMRAVMDLVHKIALAQVGEGEPDAPSAEERAALAAWAEALTAPQVHRLWQLLLKGHDEVRMAPDPLVSARMALLRTLHASDLPDPGKLLKRMEKLAESGSLATSAAASEPAGATARTSVAWEQLIEQVERAGQHHAAAIMKLQVRVVELEAGRLVFSRAPEFVEDVSGVLKEALALATGQKWQVEERRDADAAPSLVEQTEVRRAEEKSKLRDHPLVKATFEAFPDAEFVEDGDTRGQTNWRHSA